MIARRLKVFILNGKHLRPYREPTLKVVRRSPFLDKTVLDLGIDKPFFRIGSRRWVFVQFEMQLKFVWSFVTPISCIDSDLIYGNLVNSSQTVINRATILVNMSWQIDHLSVRA